MCLHKAKLCLLAQHEKFRKCLLNAYEKHLNSGNHKRRMFNLKTDERVMSVEYNQILFFETSNKIHKINLHLFNEVLEFYAKLKDIEEQLDERFYRCHNAYIANVENISEINIKEKTAIMKNGSKCLVSRRLLRGLINLYENISLIK